MKLRLFSICTGLILTFGASILMAGTIQGPEIKTIPLRFKPGTTSATVAGVIKGRSIVDYKFKASGGQTLKAKLTTRSTSLYFNILAAENQATGEALDVEPRAIELTEWEGTLPKDGEYIIRLYMNRAAARRGASANYSLLVDIK